MAKVLTWSSTNDTVLCGAAVPPPPATPTAHGGKVTADATPGKRLTVDGKAVLLSSSVVLEPVTGCKNPASSSTPPKCTSVASVTAGTSSKLTVGGAPVLLDTLVGTTAPPPSGGTLAVGSVQQKLTAG